ncbi:MAG: ornithine--oxo-acid transaminase [Desulfobacula sp.]|jgi:ornithine--oxo-acid transaminase|uniref:ornithine--oxo-acid transaminase n=2 Tax=Desulfobacula sp. TaxID=2593537 RepID=UPI001E0E0FE1|nr:ornithine--oxo-acid transaminase [Desulfobacula sp.]MBT3486578.1 ornithine--oxo-acid transaminase [Desulfobacula sp.]MBT3805763.1 ornithine--oxo-acid transaminase [Desulfobacula sp.]MBT4023946.1 ornithine--oxo-acid transaminase [Desulfobacula sp.]MBT4200352.1 ornithine--oxo-acid transaminase [Desulfobacula sp.]
MTAMRKIHYFSGFSNENDKAIFNLEEDYGAHHYDRINLVVRHAKGCWLTDEKGNKYLDCLAAYSAANSGHHHPTITNAVMDALIGNYASVLSNVVFTDPLGIFLSEAAKFAPQMAPRFGNYGNKVLPKNGGVESVETAVKTMRYFGFKHKKIADGNQEIIVFNENFHGRTISIVSFSSNQKYKQGFGPLTPGFVSVEFGNLEQVKKAINKNTCGILVEPMQGEGGMKIPPKGFLKGLRNLCDEHDLLLICDEIQVGMGRTGKKFCFEHDNIVPDGVILGKALSGGLIPLSVFITNAKIMDMVFSKGSDGSTFGGYPLACVAGTAALKVFEEEKLAEQSAKKGKILKKRIEAIAKKSPHVKEVRGKGLFIGIEVKENNAMEFCRKLLKLGLIVNDSHGHTIRISPPLIINEEEMDFMVKQLEKVLVD